MNSLSRCIGCFFFLIFASCGKLDDIQQGCTIRVSEKVFSGKFAAEDVTSIRIINGVTQQTLYPLPDWMKSENAIEVNDLEFFRKFKNCMNAPGWKKEPPSVVHIRGNIQIQVSFKEGPGAYLFCRPSNHQLGVSPMFESDSYGNANEPLFELINNTLGASTHASGAASGSVPNN
jgi:hypothetical protein